MKEYATRLREYDETRVCGLKEVSKAFSQCYTAAPSALMTVYYVINLMVSGFKRLERKN